MASIQKRRDKGIIIVKTVAVILVLIGHSLQTVSGQSRHYSSMLQSNVLTHVYETIYVFHMPLFFTLSGFLLALTFDWDTFELNTTWIKRRAKRLLVPLIVVLLLYVFPIRSLTGYYLDNNTLMNLKDTILCFDVGHLWYLSTLFCLSCLFALCRRIVLKHKIITTILLFAGYFGWYLGIKEIDTLFILRYAVWVWAGMQIYHKKEFITKHQWICIAGILSMIGGFFGRVISHNEMFDFIMGVVMTIGIIITCYALAWKIQEHTDSRLVSYVDKKAMSIYLFHEPAMYLWFYATRLKPVNPYILNFQNN